MITRRVCWAVTCDLCEEPFSTDDGQEHFRNEDTALTIATRRGWTIYPNTDRVICDQCKETS